MDFESQAKIVSTHKHLIACNTKSSQPVVNSGTSTVDDSGPPSPSSGVVKNFAEVAPGIYRSSFPTLVGTKNETTEFTDFLNDEGIRHVRVEVPAHKKPQVVIPIDVIIKVFTIMSDSSKYPLLVNCNKGKHRTGCMVACYRKLHGWTNAAIVTEYRKFAEQKFRPLDEAFMRSFNAELASQVLNGVNVPYIPLSDKAPTDKASILPTPPPSEKDTDTDEGPHPLGFSPDLGFAYYGGDEE